MFENQKKGENMEVKKFLQRSPCQRSFRYRIQACL